MPTSPTVVTMAVRFVDEMREHNASATAADIGASAARYYAHSPMAAAAAAAAESYAGAVMGGANPARVEWEMRYGR